MNLSFENKITEKFRRNIFERNRGEKNNNSSYFFVQE